MDAFVKVLEIAVERLGSQKAAIEAAGVSRQRFIGAMNGGPVFRPDKCLRLAIRSKQEPGQVLRSANLGELADAIEEIYGKPGHDKPTAEQRKFLKLLDELDDADREHLTALLLSLVGRHQKPRARPGR